MQDSLSLHVHLQLVSVVSVRVFTDCNKLFDPACSFTETPYVPLRETVCKGTCALPMVAYTSDPNTSPSPVNEDTFQPLLFEPRDENKLTCSSRKG